MRELAIQRIQTMLKIWPHLREEQTNVIKATWDELDKFTDLELLNTLERFARASYNADQGRASQ